MHDVQRRVAGKMRQIDHPGDGFCFALQRATQGMVYRRGFAGGDKPGAFAGDGRVVFGMNRGQRPGVI